MLKLKVVIVMSDIQKYINDIVDKKLKTATILKHVRGEVVDIDGNNEYANVNINGKTLKLINKSNEELSSGDEVTIHYWTNVGNGWIALRHGLSTLTSNQLSVDNAVILTAKQSSMLTTSTDTVDTYKNLIVKYGADNNCILINGYVVYPMTVSDTALSDKDSSYKTMVSNANISYQTMTLKELKEDNTVADETYQEEFMLKDWDGSNWYRYTGTVQESDRNVVMPKYVWQYNGDGALKLFFKTVYAPNSVEKSNNFEYGCADVILVREISTSSVYAPDYISLTVGFASEEEYKYALITTTRSEIEEV